MHEMKHLVTPEIIRRRLSDGRSAARPSRLEKGSRSPARRWGDEPTKRNEVGGTPAGSKPGGALAVLLAATMGRNGGRWGCQET